jgi:hypothetical protein
MSSADTDSTIEVEFCLVSIASAMARRIPTACTEPRSAAGAAASGFFLASAFASVVAGELVSGVAVSVAAVVDCACALFARIRVADARATLSKLRLSCTMSPP